MTPNEFRTRIIRPALEKINLYSLNAEILLLGTALSESDLKYREAFGGGSARGLYQMQPTTFKDLWDRYLHRRPEFFGLR